MGNRGLIDSSAFVEFGIWRARGMEKRGMVMKLQSIYSMVKYFLQCVYIMKVTNECGWMESIGAAWRAVGRRYKKNGMKSGIGREK